MKPKKKNNIITVDTLISQHSTIEGSIKSEGTLRIDGKVTGDVNSKSDVIVGETGLVEGNIDCVNIIISGIVNGNINASEQLRLTPTSRLNGDANIKSIITDEGSYFNGSCNMLIDNTKTSSKK
jgi:cytoskeletal protein CcmA (bactofilin family)